MGGDFFNEYLIPDFNALDREFGGNQWFQKQEDREQQKLMDEEGKRNAPEVEKSEDAYRSPFDRKKAKESKKDRLQRIKDEYNHKPFISVGSWECLRKRRKRRKDLLEDMEMPKENIAGGTPGFTQMVEENEATIKPIANTLPTGIRKFCIGEPTVNVEDAKAKWLELGKKLWFRYLPHYVEEHPNNVEHALEDFFTTCDQGTIIPGMKEDPELKELCRYENIIIDFTESGLMGSGEKEAWDMQDEFESWARAQWERYTGSTLGPSTQEMRQMFKLD